MGKHSIKIEDLLERIKPKHYPLLAFFLTALVYTMAFSYKQMLGNGQYTIIRGDLDFQFIPFIRQFCRVLKGEHSYWFSWSNGLGDGTALLYAYYTLSPFNLIYLLLGEGRELTATALVVILKPALAAACFQVYITKLLRKTHAGTILFAMAYALCGFSVCYYFDIIWMDALYMLPVICIGFLKLFREKKPGLLLFSYAYMFIVNFYMGYIVGLSTLILFLFYSIYKADRISRKELAGIWCRYVLTVVFAIIITAVILFPAALQLFANTDAGEDEFLMYHTNPLFLLNNLFIGEFQSFFCYTAYIYTGLFVAILVPLFFLNRKIGMRRKICIGGCLLFFILACLIKPLNILMHAFDSPGQQAYRFSFVISFLLASIACIQFPYLKNLKIKSLIPVIGAMPVIYVLSYFLYPLAYKNSDTVNSNGLTFGLINALFVAGWVGILFLFQKKDRQKEIFILFIVLFGVESVVNFGLCIDRTGIHLDDQEQYEILSNLKRDLADDLRGNPQKEFYRVRFFETGAENHAMMYDLRGISFFASADHRTSLDLLEKLGMYHGIHYASGEGMTPVVRGLLGVRSEVNADTVVYSYKPDQDVPTGIDLLRADNEDSLPICFMVSDAITEYRSERSPFENQNKILSLMTGEDIRCFEKTAMTLSMEYGKVSYDEDELTVFLHDEDTDEDAVFRYNAADQGLPLYAYLYQGRMYNVTGGMSQPDVCTEDLTETDEQHTRGITFVPSRIFLVGNNEEGEKEFTISLSGKLGRDYYKKAFFCLYHEDEWEKAYEILKRNPIYDDIINDGYLSVRVSAGMGEILFTTIPYSSGWKAYVDGEETKITPLLEDAFIGISLSEGEHEIELIYEPPGRTAGLILSVIGLVCGSFFLYLCGKGPACRKGGE